MGTQTIKNVFKKPQLKTGKWCRQVQLEWRWLPEGFSLVADSLKVKKHKCPFFLPFPHCLKAPTTGVLMSFMVPTRGGWGDHLIPICPGLVQFSHWKSCIQGTPWVPANSGQSVPPQTTSKKQKVSRPSIASAWTEETWTMLSQVLFLDVFTMVAKNQFCLFLIRK